MLLISAFNSSILKCKRINFSSFDMQNLINFHAKMHVISEIIRWKQACTRKSFCKALTKGEVRGTGKKPFAQKGRGKARQGSLKNPHQRGGGVAFPPSNQSYKYKMNKKKKHISLKSIIFHRFKYNKILLVDDLIFEKPSTQTILKLLKYFKLYNVLFIDYSNIFLELSIRNIEHSKFINIKSLSTLDIISKSHILITKKAFIYILSLFK